MKNIFRFSALMAIFLSTNLMAFDLEGVYEVSESESCGNQSIDSIVLYSDANGALHAAFSSEHYGIVYQDNHLTWDGGASLSGSSTEGSFTQGSFTASLSADQLKIEGTVDSLACRLPWSFKATRKVLVNELPQLSPLGFIPALNSFAGVYDVTTERLEGHLKLLTLGDGRLVGGFGTESAPQILRFTQARLNAAANTLELFDLDDSEIAIKWHLNYAKYNNGIFLHGYAIGSKGRYYAVQAAAL